MKANVAAHLGHACQYGLYYGLYYGITADFGVKLIKRQMYYGTE